METELITPTERLVFNRVVYQEKKLSKEQQVLLNIPIPKANLSSRVQNICWNAEIDTIANLIGYSRKDFCTLRNCGEKTCDEVELFLKSKGLFWK
jgi:DNA-directed RNA polymerase alpha subunit